MYVDEGRAGESTKGIDADVMILENCPITIVILNLLVYNSTIGTVHYHSNNSTGI